MAHCFAEPKHFNAGSLDMHSGSCNGRMHSSQVGKSHMSHVHSFLPYSTANKSKVSTSGDFCDNSDKEAGSIRGYGSFNMLGLYEKVEPTQVARKKLSIKSVHADVTGGGIKSNQSEGSERRNFTTSARERYIEEECTVTESATGRGLICGKIFEHGENVKDDFVSNSSGANILGRAASNADGMNARHTESATRSSSAAIGDCSGSNKSKNVDGSRGIIQSSRLINEKYSGENPREEKLVGGSTAKRVNLFKQSHLLLRENSVSEISAGAYLQTANASKEYEKAATEGVSDRGVTTSNLRKGSRSGEIIKESANAVDSPSIQASTSRIDNQSWPNSPANVRVVVRTRNLSEGSFNMIFAGAKKEGVVNEPRSHAGSPRQGKSRDWSRAITDSKDTGSFREFSSLKNAQTSQTIFKQSGMDTFEPVARSTDLRIVVSSSDVCSREDNASDSSDKERQTMSDALSSSSKVPTDHSCRRTPVGRIYSEGSTILPKAGNARSSTTGIITGGSFRRSEIVSAANATPIAPNAVSKGIATSFGSITNGGKLTTPPQSSYGHLTKDFNTPTHQWDSTENISPPQYHPPDEHLFLRKGLCSMDPNEVKNIGNDFYKKGGFHEALSLYDRAIALLPGQASFHSNRAAALAALGRLGDAAKECQEAIKIDLSYTRAHQRLASIFIRLGHIGDAKRHLSAAGNTDQRGLQSFDTIEGHIKRCFEASNSKNWLCVIKESDAAVVAGADSAPQIFALKAEALLRLGKTEEALRVMSAAQKMERTVNACKSTLNNSIIYVIQAKIDLALGKFQEAITSAEKAVKMEATNVDAAVILKKTRIIGKLRATGNEFFKAGKYFEASSAYGEGLELDPGNPVLLCNRAACRSNLGLWEKAIEDCNAALAVQPSYIKARLRRAHSNAKLENWEEALRDYEILRSELPGNLEVAQEMFDVQISLEKSRGQRTRTKRFGEVDEVYSSDQFRKAISSPGLAVVHFTLRSNDRCIQMSKLINQLCKQYPAVSFIKVDIEENPYLAKMENVNFVPTCKMYKNGLKVKESIDLSHQSLEQAVQFCIH